MSKLFIFLFLFHGFVFGQIVTDRPDQTEASSTVPVNSLQIEAGMVSQQFDNGNETFFTAPSVLLRYSITRVFEVRLFNQYERYSFDKGTYEIDGLSDLELGFKLQVFKRDSSKTEIALLSHAVIPTAKKELTNQSLGNISKLSISHSLNDWFGIGYNVGYSYLGKEHGFTYSFALGFSFHNKIGFYIEPFGTYLEGGGFESNFDGGITYLLKENLQLDASYGLGLNNNMNYFSFGFSWNFADVF